MCLERGADADSCFIQLEVKGQPAWWHARELWPGALPTCDVWLETCRFALLMASTGAARGGPSLVDRVEAARMTSKRILSLREWIFALRARSGLRWNFHGQHWMLVGARHDFSKPKGCREELRERQSKEPILARWASWTAQDWRNAPLDVEADVVVADLPGGAVAPTSGDNAYDSDATCDLLSDGADDSDPTCDLLSDDADDSDPNCCPPPDCC